MKIGILSDTHNNIANLRAALAIFQASGVQTLIHCGDMTQPNLVYAMVEYQVIFTYGNNDIASGEIRQILRARNPGNYAGLVYSGQLDGVRIAATHGHLVAETHNLLHCGEFDYVFTGHSHRHMDEKIGITRHINPGALGGLHPEPRSVCMLDLESGKSSFQSIDGL